MNKYTKLIYNEDIYHDLKILPLEIEGNNFCENIKAFFTEIDIPIDPMIIEVGTWKGSSAIEMAKFFLNKNPTVFCVDTWNGSAFHFQNDFFNKQLKRKNGYPTIYYQFLSNIIHNNLQDNIIPIPLNSLDGSRFIKNHLKIQSDICYIDACQEYDDVIKDLEMYYPLVKDGGIFFGDDYDTGWPGVVNAVNDFARSLSKEVYLIKSQWIILK